jgi:hypothetical protein
MLSSLYNSLFGGSSSSSSVGEEGPLPRQPVNKGDSMQIKRLIDEVATQVRQPSMRTLPTQSVRSTGRGTRVRLLGSAGPDGWGHADRQRLTCGSTPVQVIIDKGGYPEDHTAGNFKICTPPPPNPICALAVLELNPPQGVTCSTSDGRAGSAFPSVSEASAHTYTGIHTVAD